MATLFVNHAILKQKSLLRIHIVFKVQQSQIVEQITQPAQAQS